MRAEFGRSTVGEQLRLPQQHADTAEFENRGRAAELDRLAPCSSGFSRKDVGSESVSVFIVAYRLGL